MVELIVTGMTCDGCANSVRRAITREFPAASVQVDLTSGLVKIEGEIELARAQASIKQAGFGIASGIP